MSGSGKFHRLSPTYSVAKLENLPSRFSAVADSIRMLEGISMPDRAGGFSRRNRRYITIPPFPGENNSLMGLTFFDRKQKRSFSTE